MQNEISRDSTSIWAKEKYAIAVICVKTFKISYLLATENTDNGILCRYNLFSHCMKESV
jgi:hypothetical protein